MKHLLLALIGLYQFLTRPIYAILPRFCRFEPTCSHYGAEAIRTYGAWRGGWLTLKRVLKCHPLNPGGFDPVP